MILSQLPAREWQYRAHESDAHLSVVVFRLEKLVPTGGTECNDVDRSEDDADRREVLVHGLRDDPGGLAKDGAQLNERKQHGTSTGKEWRPE